MDEFVEVEEREMTDELSEDRSGSGAVEGSLAGSLDSRNCVRSCCSAELGRVCERFGLGWWSLRWAWASCASLCCLSLRYAM
jgi:hypothetical protein